MVEGIRDRIPADLALVILWTLICIPFVLVPPLNETPVRILLGLPFVLFLPGYALIALLFPRKDDLDGIERVALSFGLSIAVVPLTGLALNYTPFGIRLSPVLFSLSVLTIALAIGAILRRATLPVADRFVVEFSAAFRALRDSFAASESRLDRILTVILIIAIVVAIGMVVYVIVTPKQGEKFTEFYILGPGGKAAEYPTKVQKGEEGLVIIGVVNHEYAPVTYELTVQLAGIFTGGEILTLGHNETWERPFTFRPTQVGEAQKLEFLLFRAGQNETEPYRSLHLWVDVTNDSGG
ncbi:MAG TPA: DUF1616 domain-containing protein [Methanomicrobia archaeon]|nr:DUF1616 domain-containing protein [Methanomicrobia archaeon]